MKESKIVALALCAASLVGGGAYAFISAYQKDTAGIKCRKGRSDSINRGNR